MNECQKESSLKRYGNPPSGGIGEAGLKDTRSKFPGTGQQQQSQNVDRTRLNERIRVPEVRLIDEKGGQLGIVNTREALAMARERGLDLVEVAPEARPPVCKILDYGKLKYTKKKKEQEAKKKAAVIDIKELQLRPHIEDHDLQVKYRKMVEFLQRGDKVKVVVMFRGREMAYAKKQGSDLLNRILDMSKDICVPDSMPKLEGKRMIMVLSPAKGKSHVGTTTVGKKPEQGAASVADKISENEG